MRDDIRNPKDVQKMIDRMTSFYLEHLPIEASYQKWLDALVEAWRLYQIDLDYTDKNSLPDTAYTLRTIPYQKLNLDNAVYTKSVAKDLKRDLETEKLIVKLYELGYYAELEFWEPGGELPLIYAMNLFVDFEKNYELEINKDYFIRRNRLYFMPDYILQTNQVINKMHAYDIKVNEYNLEKNWGDDIPIRVPMLMPRYQYRELVGAYKRLMNSDFFIKDIKEAVRIVTEKEEIDIFDVVSRSIPKPLKRLYEEFYLSPLDFIVRLDEKDLYDKMQTNVILHMVSNTHEKHAYFWLFFSIFRLDEGEFEEDVDINISIGQGDDGIIDEMEAEDEDKYALTLNVEDEFFCNPFYDGTRTYDLHPIPYDSDKCDITEKDLVHLDMTEWNMDDPFPFLKMDDTSDVRHEDFVVKVIDHPEIPRQFGLSNKTIKFNKNKGFCDTYELHASSDDKQYELIKEWQHDNVSDVVTWNVPNEIASKMRYYKIRATERESISLFSLVKEDNQ